jgi:uncharacterized protein YybS (DUF2232 family)
MKITDVLGCVGWAFLFLLAGSWIPFLGPFLSLLTPLPFLFYSVKLDFLRGLELTAVSVLTLGLIAQLLGRPQVILFTLEFGIVGLALSECYSRKYSFGYTVLFGTLIMLGIGFFSLFFVALSKNMGPFEMVLTYVQGNLDETLKSYEQLGMGQEQASELQFYGKILLDVIRKIYPALMIVGTGFIVWLNVALSLPLLRIRKLNGPDFAPTDRWQAPEHLVWGVIASGFALFIPASSIRLVGINAIIVLMAIYLFQGLSILIFFLNKFRVPSWIRIGLYCLLFFQQFFLAVLAIAGLFDQWIDFRRMHRKTDS